MRSAYFSYLSKEDVKYWNQSIASLERRPRGFAWKKIIYSAIKNITTKNINMNNKAKTTKEILRYLQAFISSEFERNHVLFWFSNVLDVFHVTFRIILFESIFSLQKTLYLGKDTTLFQFYLFYLNIFKEIYWKIANISRLTEVTMMSIHFMKRIVWFGVE